MFNVKCFLVSGIPLLPLFLASNLAFGGPLSVSLQVQENISTLRETKNCPQCDLSGADLTRMDLSGANLEGANLSRAQLFLANLSGANLRHADLRETGLGGADLADADLRGADLRGTSFSGAYMGGTLLDGELTSTTPYAQEQISNMEEKVYVEDTVKAKTGTQTEEMNIGARRIFEETPPPVPVEKAVVERVEPDVKIIMDTDATAKGVAEKALVPQQSAEAPDVKAIPSLQEVRMPEPEKAVMLAENVQEGDDDQDEGENQSTGAGDVPSAAIAGEMAGVEEIGEENILQLSQQDVEVDHVTEEIVKQDPAETNLASEKEQVVEETVSEKETSEEEVDSIFAQSSSENVENDNEDAEEVSVVTGVQTGIEKVQQTEEVAVAEEIVLVESPLDTERRRNVDLLLDSNKCYGCNLEGVDLSGKDLEDSDLEGANLRNANLNGTDLEGANLKGADLSGADLKKADLSGADLYKADLTDADLTGANLDETLLDDAILTGVKGYQQGTLLMME